MYGEVIPQHLPERFMLADPFTKYLPYDKWARHRRFILNLVEAA